MIHLAWHEAAPDQGHDAQAARYQAMIGIDSDNVENRATRLDSGRGGLFVCKDRVDCATASA